MDTFKNVQTWLGEIKAHANPDVLVYLIGNKVDCEDGERQVSKEEALEFCQTCNISKMFETSAKTGEMVQEVFSLCAKEMYYNEQA